jgi:hypothetical protein
LPTEAAVGDLHPEKDQVKPENARQDSHRPEIKIPLFSVNPEKQGDSLFIYLPFL